MLGALSLKWQWRKRREAANEATDRPNLVFGGDVHVVWEKFCRYFDVEPRIVPLKKDKYTIGPEDVEPHIDENTIGVAAVLGTTFTGHADDIVGINRLLIQAFDAGSHEFARTYIDVWYDKGSTTSVSGTLPAGTTHWTAAGGPYHVTSNLTVPAGAILQIDPGTNVYFDPGVRLTVRVGTVN